MKNLKLNRTSIALVFFLIFTSIPLYVFGYDSSQLYLKTKRSGSEITVNVCIDSEKELNAFQFDMFYDSSVLKLESAAIQGAYAGMMNAMNTEEPGSVKVAAVSATAIKESGDKNVLKAVFLVKNDTEIKFKLSNAVLGFDDDKSEYPADKSFVISDSGNNAGKNEPGESLPGNDNSSNSNSGGVNTAPSNGSSKNEESGDSSINTGSLSAAIFNDISDSWAQKYIIAAYNANLMQGYGDSIFGPEKQITRAQMAVVLWNAEGKQKPSKPAGFTDLNADWYKDAAAWVAEKGYMKGVGNNKFAPNSALTREQLAQIMMNKSGQNSGMEMMFASLYDSQYKDSASISSWAKPALYWSLYNGLLCGTDSIELKDTLSAKQPASRAETAVMLVKYQEKFAFI